MNRTTYISFSILGIFLLAIVMTACASAPTEQVAEEPEVVEEAHEAIQVAFIYVGPISDEGWTWSHDQGRLAVEEAYGDLVETWYTENTPFSEEATRTIEQYIADGADMVIVTSGYADFVTKAAERHPDVAFLHMTRTPIDNELAYYISHEYPSYLIGMAAGLMTETNQLGYVGSFPSTTVKASVNSFHLGARSVNPDVTTRVALINSWFDPAAARQAAEALADSGVDFLFGIMDEAAYLEVAEERGIWAAMWNTDVRRFGPNAYVSSVILDWSSFYVDQVGKVLDGTWDEGGDTILLPIGEGVDRDVWGQNVPEDVQEQVDAIRDRMINEGYNPFTGPLYDIDGNLRLEEGQELTPLQVWLEWDWVVEGVVGLE
ncbi:MAG: BMP family ABC transporter substrate-binding protein [Candidatus Aenigmatarchaeota archaeon]|nr:MAG: BMP family ABC transporter substrate-binding protein [Candidatus Aenigmarchaeota archaeon]